MGQAGPFLRKINGGYLFFCPACDNAHGVATGAPHPPDARWTFDGNLASPTFKPSVRAFTTYDVNQKLIPNGGTRTLCHLFVTAGKVAYCADSPHALAGKTIDLPVLPAWLQDKVP